VKFRTTLLFIFLFCLSGVAQEQVSWTFSFDKEESELFVHATIEEGWHLYSTEKVSDFGPVPTEIVIKEENGVIATGRTKEPKPIVAYDPNFEETLYFYEEKVTFSQKIELNDAKEVHGVITYMVCNDSMCMPPVDVEFTINVSNEN